MTLATLDEDELPCWFKYTPLIPKKRVFYKETARGIVSQRSTIPIIEQGQIPFVMTAPNEDAANIFCRQYFLQTEPIVFTGYYGDSYEVEISEMTVKVEGGIHYIEGIFQVLCTISSFCPSC